MFEYEYLIRLHDSNANLVHTVIVYKLEKNNNSFEKRLWMAARGYAGNGIYEEYSTKCIYDVEGYLLEQYSGEAYPRFWNEIVNIDNPLNINTLLEESDRILFNKMWNFIDNHLVKWTSGFNNEMISRIELDKFSENSFLSDGFDGETLTDIAAFWPLNIRF